MMGSWLQLGWLKRAVGRKLQQRMWEMMAPPCQRSLLPVVKIVVSITIISAIMMISIIIIAIDMTNPDFIIKTIALRSYISMTRAMMVE